MISITKVTTDKQAYFCCSFLTDAAIGMLASIATIPVALLLGGFSFIEPWVIVIVPLMFAAGILRGNSDGNVWLKGVALSLCYLLILMLIFVDTNAEFLKG